MRPTKERLNELRVVLGEGNAVYHSEALELLAEIDALEADLRGKPPLNVQASKTIPQLLDQIDALTTELKASEWVRRDNSLRTYDGLTEENERLREHLAYITKTRDTYADMLKHSLDHHKQCHGECSFIFAHSDDTQAAPRCKHDIHGNDCVKCYPSEVK